MEPLPTGPMLRVRVYEDMAVVVLATADEAGSHLLPPRLVQRLLDAWQSVAEAEDDIVGWLETSQQYPPEAL